MLIQEFNRYKTTFTTKSGTYAYCKMSSGLASVGPTFQKAMKMAFKGMLENFVLVYLDDIIVFSKHAIDHFDHLRQVFIRSREYGMSLNPKECVFSSIKESF